VRGATRGKRGRFEEKRSRASAEAILSLHGVLRVSLKREEREKGEVRMTNDEEEKQDRDALDWTIEAL